MKNLKKFGFALLILALPLFLIGCGDEGSSGSGSGGFVQGVTDDTIFIANSAAASGPLAGVGVPFLAGMNAYIEMVNTNGGVHGRMIEKLHIDDEFTPALGTAALQGFIEDDEVFAIVGHFGTPVIGATFPILVESGIPTVYFAAGIGDVYNENATDGDGRNTFPVQPVFPMEGRIFAAWAVGEFGAETIGLIRTNDDAGRDFYNGVMQEAAVLGVEVVTAVVEPGSPDVTAEVATLLAADVDVVVAGSIQGTIIPILAGLAAQGNTAPVITSYVNADVSIAGHAADLVIGREFEVYASSWVNVFVDELDSYQEWIARVSDEDFSLNSFAITGWIAMHFFVEGLERAGADLTWESFIEAMESAPIQNPFGSAIDFANGNRVGTEELALVRMDHSHEMGWEAFLDFMGMDQILGQ